MKSASDVAVAAQLACLLEVSAPKPWNVSPGRHFGDARFEHFLASAAAIGPVFAAADRTTVGGTVLRAVEATAHWTHSNTNLGMVLLLAPLARAVLVRERSEAHDDANQVTRSMTSLRAALRDVLHSTTIEDARDVYAAIRLASPGGLGSAPEQDVASAPTVTLLEAMRLAADRDGIASEYATDFAVTFEHATPALLRARGDGLSWDDAIVETFLTLLADRLDTHIIRRSGEGIARTVSQRARDSLAAGGVRSPSGRRAIDEMDAALRDARHSANPGTTADVIAAAIFVALVCGGWPRWSRS